MVGIIFGLGKCALLVLKGGKMFRTERIELPDKKRITEVNLEGHKFLEVLQLDSKNNKEIKKKVKSEYIRRVKSYSGYN